MPLNPMVARRYANALFQLSNEKASTNFFGKSSQILAELKAFSEALRSVKEGPAFFLNPTISRDEKIEVVKDLENKLPLTYRFITTLIDAGRLEYFDEISSEFQRACENASGELTVQVEFAHEPSGGLLEEVRAMLQGEWKKEIKIQASLNPQIIGGFIAKAPGRVMDVSVLSQIEALEQQLSA